MAPNNKRPPDNVIAHHACLMLIEHMASNRIAGASLKLEEENPGPEGFKAIVIYSANPDVVERLCAALDELEIEVTSIGLEGT